MQWKPNVTVAAIIERDGRYLMVEERPDRRIVYNQPAGHLERGESLLDAIRREVREETAWAFEAEGLVGVYLYPHPDPARDITYLRFCFHGRCHDHRPEQALDQGIIQAPWLSREELLEQQAQLRSPLVLECIDDYRAGHSYPLEMLSHHLPTD